MAPGRTLCVLSAAATLLTAPAIAPAQDAITGPTQKTIGSGNAKIEPALIVMNARGAALQGGKLTLTGVSANSIKFADRPVRAAGHALTAQLLEEWNGSDSFGKDPPNATVSVLSKDGLSVQDAVVVLKSPKMDGDSLTFDAQALEGDLMGGDGPAAVLIEIIGLPFTPYSVAEAARRTAYRSAGCRGYAAAAAPCEPGPEFVNPGYSMPWQ